MFRTLILFYFEFLFFNLFFFLYEYIIPFIIPQIFVAHLRIRIKCKNLFSKYLRELFNWVLPEPIPFFFIQMLISISTISIYAVGKTGAKWHTLGLMTQK